MLKFYERPIIENRFLFTKIIIVAINWLFIYTYIGYTYIHKYADDLLHLMSTKDNVAQFDDSLTTNDLAA